MNIDTFGLAQAHNETSGDVSFAQDEVATIKQKIENRKAKRKKLKLILGSLGSLVFILAALVVYSQYKLYKLSKDELIVDGAKSAVNENATSTPATGEDIIKRLGRHILLPQGTPQIAEVQDVAKLKDTQAFFKDAENGDIVVVYETMIYIYRPSADIVIASSDISGVGQKKP
jgi:hypothetical protein